MGDCEKIYAICTLPNECQGATDACRKWCSGGARESELHVKTIESKYALTQAEDAKRACDGPETKIQAASRRCLCGIQWACEAWFNIRMQSGWYVE